MEPITMDLSADKSRKRPRSVSSIPEASSPKRAASEDLVDASIQTASLTTLPPTADEPEDHGIDEYMAQQDEATATTAPAMTPAEKLEWVLQTKQRSMQIGESWFLVANQWWRKWVAACKGEATKEEEPVTEDSLGEVDNVPLMDRDQQLNVGFSEGNHFELVPREVWDRLVDWYGPCKYPLERLVIAQGTTEMASVEIYPLSIRIHRMSMRGGSTNGNRTPKISISKRATVQALIDMVAENQPAVSAYPRRLWKVDSNALETDPQSVLTLFYPVSRVRSDGAVVFGESEEDRNQTLEEALWDHGDAVIVETKVASQWPSEVDPSPATTPPVQTTTAMQASSSRTGLSMMPFMNRSRVQETPRAPGTIGLTNMGNTCFMNSALQCLAHTPELTDYFINGVYRNELNPTNPLGMGGAIAKVFGALLDKVWASSGAGAFAPREFKAQLQKFAPQFSGYQQHDSQELLAFLLDGLHEDLNRVLKKPYVENPDWEGGGMREMAALAKTTWEGYMKRNDSVIVDLFQGQYKSTLVCPECEKVSITFDPFMYLTLPLPVDKMWRHTVHVIPYDFDKPHVKVPIEVPNHGTFRDLKVKLGRWLEMNPENFYTTEIYNNRFYKFYDDDAPVTDVSDKDIIAIFELPCPARQSRESLMKPYNEDEDWVVLPVFHRMAQPNSIRPSFSTSSGNFGYPFLVAISPEDVKSEAAIYAALVERYTRWTTSPRDLYRWEGVDHVPDEEPQPTTVTEIRENGEVVETVEQEQEQDIGEMRPAEPDADVVMEDGATENGVPMQPLGPQPGLFDVTLYSAVEDKMETGWQMDYNSDRIVSFTERAAKRAELPKNRYFVSFYDKRREDKPKPDPNVDYVPVVAPHPLVRNGDAIVCAWDPNLRDHFLADRTRGGTARFDHWDTFMHQEMQAAIDAQKNKRQRGISIDDCLNEFAKEEQLGEQDLWYCPRCKKHQPATKKFELWKVPDVLVVHLKRFSNSRLTRDKIDELVEFPIEGLSLDDRVGERQAAKSLLAEGASLEELGLSGDLEEPLVYDLFAVDEHMGGLGGGHYRAYAKNHLDDKWYHFDDSFVTPAKAEDSVTASAYLLFYRRRSDKPLGGETYEKIEIAKKENANKPPESSPHNSPTPAQLPTPPNEDDTFSLRSKHQVMDYRTNSSGVPRQTVSRIMESVPDSPFSTPSHADDPPNFFQALDDPLISGAESDIVDLSRDDVPSLVDNEYDGFHPSLSQSASPFHVSRSQGGSLSPPSPTSSIGVEQDFDSEFPTTSGPGGYSPQSEGYQNWSVIERSPSSNTGKLEDAQLDDEPASAPIPPTHPDSQSPEALSVEPHVEAEIHDIQRPPTPPLV